MLLKAAPLSAVSSTKLIDYCVLFSSLCKDLSFVLVSWFSKHSWGLELSELRLWNSLTPSLTLGIFKIYLWCWTISFMSSTLWHDVVYVCYKASSFKAFVFPPSASSMKWFYGCRTGRGLRCVTQSCTAVGGVCGDFFGVCEHYSLVLCEMKESGEIDSSPFFPSFIVSSAYCLLQWGKLIMSSTPCLTPPSPFIQIITLGNHNEFVVDHFGFGERKGKKILSPFVSTQTGRWQLRTTFWPLKAVASNSFRAQPSPAHLLASLATLLLL